MSTTTERVDRALSEELHAERLVPDEPDLFWIHSGSGERYAVDLGGDHPLCTCDDWIHRAVFCKHIWRALLIDPEALARFLSESGANEEIEQSTAVHQTRGDGA